MNNLGFYQVYELDVDFTQKVREEISPLFDNEKYVVLDGLHRSIIQMNENKKDILACQILD